MVIRESNKMEARGGRQGAVGVVWSLLEERLGRGPCKREASGGRGFPVRREHGPSRRRGVEIAPSGTEREHDSLIEGDNQEAGSGRKR